MPRGTPEIKVRNVERLGAKVVLHGVDFDEAKAECARLAKNHGLIFVPPYDDPLVIAGQGTVGSEILKQIPNAETLALRCGSAGTTFACDQEYLHTGLDAPHEALDLAMVLQRIEGSMARHLPHPMRRITVVDMFSFERTTKEGCFVQVPFIPTDAVPRWHSW